MVSINPRRPKVKKKPNESLRIVDPDTMIEAKTLKNILELQRNQEEDNTSFLQMEQIGVCGVPSLWTPMHKLITQRHVPRELILLLEKYHKMFVILKCHKKWENEKMFGKSAQSMNFAGQ